MVRCGLLALVLLELASRAGETGWLVRLGEFDGTLAKVLFIPSALLALVTGVALVFDGPWSFTGDGWVFAGLVLLAGIFALGVGLIVPAGQKLTALAKSGATTTELEEPVRRLRMRQLDRRRPARGGDLLHDDQAVLSELSHG